MPHHVIGIIMCYDYRDDEPALIKTAVAGTILGALLLIIVLSVTGCTLSLTNVMSSGVASDLVDEDQGASADLKATVPVVP